MTALVLKHNDVDIQMVKTGGWVALPDGRKVSPAYAGWESGDGYSLEEYTAPPPPPLTPEEQAAIAAEQQKAAEIEAIRDRARQEAFIQQFITMTPDQVIAHVDANVTNIASAKTLLKQMAVMMLIMARREFGD